MKQPFEMFVRLSLSVFSEQVNRHVQISNDSS